MIGISNFIAAGKKSSRLNVTIASADALTASSNTKYRQDLLC